MKKEFIENLKSLGNVTITQNSDGSILISPVKNKKENVLKIDSNTVVHCETEELANAVLGVVHNLGFKWCDGESYKECNNFLYYEKQTCYELEKGIFSDLDYFKKSGYKIISAKKFLKLHNTCDKFEVKKTWENLKTISGYFVNNDSYTVCVDGISCIDASINTASSKRVCKAMLSMAQISQILKKWYNPFTEEERNDKSFDKYLIYYNGEKLRVYSHINDRFPSFRSKEDAEEFLSFKENYNLVLDYFMIDHD